MQDGVEEGVALQLGIPAAFEHAEHGVVLGEAVAPALGHRAHGGEELVAAVHALVAANLVGPTHSLGPPDRGPVRAEISGHGSSATSWVSPGDHYSALRSIR